MSFDKLKAFDASNLHYVTNPIGYLITYLRLKSCSKKKLSRIRRAYKKSARTRNLSLGAYSDKQASQATQLEPHSFPLCRIESICCARRSSCFFFSPSAVAKMQLNLSRSKLGTAAVATKSSASVRLTLRLHPFSIQVQSFAKSMQKQNTNSDLLM